MSNIIFPDISGQSLAFMESPGTEYICLNFQALSSDPTVLITTYLYLYGANIEYANFTCDPFFPPTKSVSFSRESDIGRSEMQISFETGNLSISFTSISLHVTEQKLREV
jgi:hypothetical protein